MHAAAASKGAGMNSGQQAELMLEQQLKVLNRSPRNITRKTSDIAVIGAI
jgi:hypothetical protein